METAIIYTSSFKSTPNRTIISKTLASYSFFFIFSPKEGIPLSRKERFALGASHTLHTQNETPSMKLKLVTILFKKRCDYLFRQAFAKISCFPDA